MMNPTSHQTARRGWLVFCWLWTIAIVGLGATQTWASMPDEAVELEPIRYRDPEHRRELWTGVDLAGVVIPTRLGLFDRRVWVVRVEPSWALNLFPGVAIGGRHGLTWYDATNAASAVRSRIHAHWLELSIRPLRRRSIHDRLAIGYQSHRMAEIRTNGRSFKVGGIDDRAITLGYGIDHNIARRWQLGWQLQLRYVWVYLDRQRQARLSARIAFTPRSQHRLWVESVGYGVIRDEDQAGEPVPRLGVLGQFHLGYQWMSRIGLGIAVQGSINTAFLSGEAPIYEIREESLKTPYGELLLGFRARLR